MKRFLAIFFLLPSLARADAMQSLMQQWWASSAALVEANNLVAYWKLDGDGTDYMGSYNATVTGCHVTNGVTGAANTAYLMDGNDYLAASSNAANFGTGNFTVCGWFKATSTEAASYNYMLDHDNAGTPFWIMYISSGAPVAYFRDADNRSAAKVLLSTDLSTNVWTHWATVRNGTICAFYKDGVFKGAQTNALFIGSINSVAPFTIGCNYNGGSRRYHYKGVVDNVRAYNVALTASQLLNIVGAKQ